MTDDPNKVVAELGAAFAEFKRMHAQELDELRKGVKAAPADLTKVEAAIDALQAANDALGAKLAAETKFRADLEKKLNRPGAGDGDGAAKLETEAKAFNVARESWNLPGGAMTAESLPGYKRGFASYLRKGEKAFSAEEFKTMQVGGDPDGGYFVTPDVSGRIVTKLYETSPMRQLATVQAVSTDKLEGIEDLGEAGAGYADERTTSGDATTPGPASLSVASPTRISPAFAWPASREARFTTSPTTV